MTRKSLPSIIGICLGLAVILVMGFQNCAKMRPDQSQNASGDGKDDGGGIRPISPPEEILTPLNGTLSLHIQEGGAAPATRSLILTTQAQRAYTVKVYENLSSGKALTAENLKAVSEISASVAGDLQRAYWVSLDGLVEGTTVSTTLNRLQIQGFIREPVPSPLPAGFPTATSWGNQKIGTYRIAFILAQLTGSSHDVNRTAVDDALTAVRERIASMVPSTRFNLTTSVFGPVSISANTTGCLPTGAWNLAVEAAVKDSSLRTGDYKQIFVILPTQPSCSHKGRASLEGSVALLNGFSGLETSQLLHFIGHGLGLHHASANNVETGDASTVMGGMDKIGATFSAIERLQLGWLPSAAVTDFSGRTGTLTQDLTPVDSSGAGIRLIAMDGYWISRLSPTLETATGVTGLLVHTRPSLSELSFKVASSAETILPNGRIKLRNVSTQASSNVTTVTLIKDVSNQIQVSVSGETSVEYGKRGCQNITTSEPATVTVTGGNPSPKTYATNTTNNRTVQHCENNVKSNLSLAISALTVTGKSGSANMSFSVFSPYQDLSLGDPRLDWAVQVTSAKLMSDCQASPRNFCPDATLSRAEIANFAARGMVYQGQFSGAGGSDPYEPTAPPIGQAFEDVTSYHAQFNAVQRLWEQGVVMGTQARGASTPRLYTPDSPGTRAQAAVIFIRALAPAITPKSADLTSREGEVRMVPTVQSYRYECQFSDVTAPLTSDPFYSVHYFWHIQKACDQDFILPCTSGQYCPNGNVSRADVLRVLAKGFLNLP